MLKDRFLTTLLLLSLWVILLQLCLTFLTYGNLPPLVPLFYTRLWGPNQLAAKHFILLIPIVSLVIFAFNNFIVQKLLRKREEFPAYCLGLLTVFFLGVLTLANFHSISSVSVLPSNLPWFLRPAVITTLALSFLLAVLFTLPTLRLAQRLGFMDNPRSHKHPAMLLTRSIARGGALPLYLAFLITSLSAFVPDKRITYILLVAGAAVVVGLIDDKFDLSPYLRLAFQLLITVFIVLVGVQIDYINHPLGTGVLPLTQIIIRLGHNFSILPVAIILASFWILWTMNMISWSNGVDGQFPLIVCVAALVIGILGLNDPHQFKTSIMAFAIAGAALGTLPFSWHPSKILYGFGATSIGFLLAVLSILNGTKVATSLLVLLVPTLDAAFIIFRRIRTGRSPFRGDRNHLHHKLLDLGLSQRQISIFYGLAGMILGSLAIVSSGQGKLLAIITGTGVFIFILTLVNYLPKSSEEKIKDGNQKA